MSTQAINSSLLDRLKDKRYRDLFIASQINRIIPFQIRALRAARNNMTQAELAEKADTKQSVISRIQNNGAANLNIKSLLKLASAFDVALVVRFEPIDKFIGWVDDLSPEAMSPKPSDVVVAEAGSGPHEAGVAAAKSAGIFNAEHLFPGLPATATQVHFLPGMLPAGVATINEKQETASTEISPVESSDTRTTKSMVAVAGGRDGR